MDLGVEDDTWIFEINPGFIIVIEKVEIISDMLHSYIMISLKQ